MRINEVLAKPAVITVKGKTKVMSHLMFGLLVLSADQLMRLRRR